MAPAPSTTTRWPGDALGQHPLDRRGHQGRGGPVDAGLGPGALADPQRLLEQHVERGTHAALLLAAAQRLAGLAEDLALADRHRVQPGGDVEQVGDRAVLVVHVEVRQHRLGRLAGPLHEQARELLDAAVEPVDLGVDLEPVAGGDDRGLGDRRARLGVGDQLGDTVGVERDPLQQRHRGRVVGDAHHEDAHEACSRRSGGSGVSGVAAPRRTPDLRCSW